MKEINRSVLIVRSKEPFLYWLNSLPDPGDYTLEDINRDQSAFLLLEYEDDRKQENILGKYFTQIFEEKLFGWWTDPEAWPSKRDLKTFKKWFDVEFHSIVYDLVNRPLLVVE